MKGDLKPLQMCVLFRHGAAQGLLSEVRDLILETFYRTLFQSDDIFHKYIFVP